MLKETAGACLRTAKRVSCFPSQAVVPWDVQTVEQKRGAQIFMVVFERLENAPKNNVAHRAGMSNSLACPRRSDVSGAWWLKWQHGTNILKQSHYDLNRSQVHHVMQLVGSRSGLWCQMLGLEAKAVKWKYCAFPPPGPLGGVKNLRVTDPTMTSLNVKWDPADGAVRQYKIFFVPTAGGPEEMVRGRHIQYSTYTNETFLSTTHLIEITVADPIYWYLILN